MRRAFTGGIAALVLSLTPLCVQAQQGAKGRIIVPESSIERAEDYGRKAHTNYLIFKPNDGNAFTGYTPAQIRAAYGLSAFGGSKAIAIVDAFHFPTALQDFNTFSSTFGLPTESSTNATSAGNKVFQIVYATGRVPQRDLGWNVEEALDIQWAHAMAPKAKIYLVEARSSSFFDLFTAVQKAASLPDVKEVSMSWGGGEFFGEQMFDLYLKKPGVVFLSSSGDFGGYSQYPAASTYVLSVGGTTLALDSANNVVSETAWGGSGGGPSPFIATPAYQSVIAGLLGGGRGQPDMSLVADPATGAQVYVTGLGWGYVGGTSLSSPALAGMINAAGHFYSGTAAQLTKAYGFLSDPLNYSLNFYDITSGAAGGFLADPGYDFITGIGSPRGLGGL